MRKVILLFILITSVLGAWADGNVTFTASAPDVVVSGDQFRLTYTVNTHKVRDFRAPNIKGFDVLMGPSRSQQSSTQIINGNVTSTSSITFTYILMADKELTPFLVLLLWQTDKTKLQIPYKSKYYRLIKQMVLEVETIAVEELLHAVRLPEAK
jgi:hypothetical protein